MLIKNHSKFIEDHLHLVLYYLVSLVLVQMIIKLIIISFVSNLIKSIIFNIVILVVVLVLVIMVGVLIHIFKSLIKTMLFSKVVSSNLVVDPIDSCITNAHQVKFKLLLLEPMDLLMLMKNISNYIEDHLHQVINY